MKFRKLFTALVALCAFIATPVVFTSCTSDSDSENDGFSPIRPTRMVIDGDSFELTTTGYTFSSFYLYDFTVTLADPSLTTINNSGYYTYTDSTSDSRTKTIKFYYDITSVTFSDGDITGFNRTYERTLVVMFDSSTTGTVVSDSWYGDSDSNLSQISYASGATIEFYK